LKDPIKKDHDASKRQDNLSDTFPHDLESKMNDHEQPRDMR
jgi:hypothetical protein